MKYLAALQRGQRFEHTIWPQHCIIGSLGHNVVGVLNAALQDWTRYTGKDVFYVMKGQNCRTEMYSALEAEVEDPTDSNTALNSKLLEMLRLCDKVVVAGEALSHCVNFTMRDIVKHWHHSKSRLVLLKDGE